MYVEINILVNFQLGGFYLWTYTYQLVKTSSMRLKALEVEESEEKLKVPNHTSNGDLQAHLLPVSLSSTTNPLLEKVTTSKLHNIFGGFSSNSLPVTYRIFFIRYMSYTFHYQLILRRNLCYLIWYQSP